MNNKNSEWSNTQYLELLLHGDNRTEFQGLWKTLHQWKISECSIVKIQMQIRHAVNRLCLWQCLLWQIMWLYCSLFGVHNTCTYFKPIDTGELWLQPHRWWSTVSAEFYGVLTVFCSDKNLTVELENHKFCIFYCFHSSECKYQISTLLGMLCVLMFDFKNCCLTHRLELQFT